MAKDKVKKAVDEQKEQEVKEKKRAEMNEEKKEKMQLGRMYGQIRSGIHSLIDYHAKKEIDAAEVLDKVNAFVEKTFETYEDQAEMAEELKALQEKYGDKFIIKSRKYPF